MLWINLVIDSITSLSLGVDLKPKNVMRQPPRDPREKIPSNTAALCLPRSSLLRCGATLECAVWDPGYEGRSEALLLVKNDHGLILKKNAKIGQMVFIILKEEAMDLYEGQYKGENK